MTVRLLGALFLLNGALAAILDIVAGEYRKPEAQRMPYVQRFFGREAYVPAGQKWRAMLLGSVVIEVGLFLLIAWFMFA